MGGIDTRTEVERRLDAVEKRLSAIERHIHDLVACDYAGAQVVDKIAEDVQTLAEVTEELDDRIQD